VASALKIYVDRLKEGHKEKIDLILPPDLMEVNEQELAFLNPITLKGETYLAEDHLVLHLQLETKATLPCIVCNQAVKIPLVIQDFYHAEPIAEIKGAIFDYTEKVREALLLQTPIYIECSNGKCPERKTLNKYLKTTSPSEKGSSEEHPHFPFANL